MSHACKNVHNRIYFGKCPHYLRSVDIYLCKHSLRNWRQWLLEIDEFKTFMRKLYIENVHTQKMKNAEFDIPRLRGCMKTLQSL